MQIQKLNQETVVGEGLRLKNRKMRLSCRTINLFVACFKARLRSQEENSGKEEVSGVGAVLARLVSLDNLKLIFKWLCKFTGS